MAQEDGVDVAATVAAVVEQQNGGDKPSPAAVVFASFKPQLSVPSLKAEEAVQFYKAAFGAEELNRVNHPKRKADQELPLVLCAELKVGPCSFCVCEQTDDAALAKVGDGSVLFRLETEDVQGAVAKAVDAGAVLDGEVAEDDGPCGGGLIGKLKDPFGVVWAIAAVGNKCCAADAEVDAVA